MYKPVSKSKNSVPSDRPRRQPLPDQSSQLHQLSQTIVFCELQRKPVLFSKVTLTQSPSTNLSLKTQNQRASNDKLFNNKLELPLKGRHGNSLQQEPENIITPQKHASYNNDSYKLSPYCQVSRTATPETPFYTQTQNEVQLDDKEVSPAARKRFLKDDPYITIGKDSRMQSSDDYYTLIQQNNFLKTGEMSKYDQKSIRAQELQESITAIQQENEQLKIANKEFFEENKALFEQIQELQNQQQLWMNELQDLRKQSQRMEKINEAYINSVDQAFEVESIYKAKLDQKEVELEEKDKIIKGLRKLELEQRDRSQHGNSKDKNIQSDNQLILQINQLKNQNEYYQRMSKEEIEKAIKTVESQFNQTNKELYDQLTSEKQMRLKAEKEVKDNAEKLENYQRDFMEKQKMIFELKQDNDEKNRKLSLIKQDVDSQLEKFKVDLQLEQNQHQNEINIKNNTIEQLMRTIQKLQRERLIECKMQGGNYIFDQQQDECGSVKSSCTFEQQKTINNDIESYVKQLEGKVELQRQQLESCRSQLELQRSQFESIKSLEQKYILQQATSDQLEKEKKVCEQKLVEMQTQLTLIQNSKQSSFGKEAQKMKQIIQIQKSQIESQQKTILNQHYEIQNLQNLIYQSNEIDYSKTLTSQCDQDSDKQSSSTSKQNKRMNWESTQKNNVLQNISNKFNDLSNFTMKPLIIHQANEDTFRNLENE